MAEIGVIASIIQVAGAGLKLSQTLYQYADSVSSADRRVKDIAKEVQLTSFVIQELGDIFKNSESSALLSKNAIKTADETLIECSTVFTELDAAINKTKRSAFGKFKFPFKEPKIELLRSHIDKLKSTLQLLMHVLSHAHQIASQKLGQEAVAAQREEIKALLQNKKASAKRYEESLKNYRGSDDEEEPAKAIEDLQSSSSIFRTSSIASSITVDNLATCVQHVKSLLENIENLQQVLADSTEGKDTSDHHQNLVDSYFRAQCHLESVLLGNPTKRKLSISGTTLHSELSRTSTESGRQSTIGPDSHPRSKWSDADFEKALLEAKENAKREERESIEREGRLEQERLMALAEARAKDERTRALEAEVEKRRREIEEEKRRRQIEDAHKPSTRAYMAEEVQSDSAARGKHKRRKEAGRLQKECANCHTRTTPEWRRGPSGNRDLCNTCGLQWARKGLSDKLGISPQESTMKRRNGIEIASEESDDTEDPWREFPTATLHRGAQRPPKPKLSDLQYKETTVIDDPQRTIAWGALGSMGATRIVPERSKEGNMIPEGHDSNSSRIPYIPRPYPGQEKQGESRLIMKANDKPGMEYNDLLEKGQEPILAITKGPIVLRNTASKTDTDAMERPREFGKTKREDPSSKYIRSDTIIEEKKVEINVSSEDESSTEFEFDETRSTNIIHHGHRTSMKFSHRYDDNGLFSYPSSAPGRIGSESPAQASLRQLLSASPSAKYVQPERPVYDDREWGSSSEEEDHVGRWQDRRMMPPPPRARHDMRSDLGAGTSSFSNRNKDQARLTSENRNPQEIDVTKPGDQVRHRRVSELNSRLPDAATTSVAGYYGRDRTASPFPTISELDSPPAELYTPPPVGYVGHSNSDPPQHGQQDYFSKGSGRDRRRRLRGPQGSVDIIEETDDLILVPHKEGESRRQEQLQLAKPGEVDSQSKEREGEARIIEQSVRELNELFRDVAHIVQEQGKQLDNISENVEGAHAASKDAQQKPYGPSIPQAPPPSQYDPTQAIPQARKILVANEAFGSPEASPYSFQYSRSITKKDDPTTDGKEKNISLDGLAKLRRIPKETHVAEIKDDITIPAKEVVRKKARNKNGAPRERERDREREPEREQESRRKPIFSQFDGGSSALTQPSNILYGQHYINQPSYHDPWTSQRPRQNPNVPRFGGVIFDPETDSTLDYRRYANIDVDYWTNNNADPKYVLSPSHDVSNVNKRTLGVEWSLENQGSHSQDEEEEEEEEEEKEEEEEEEEERDEDTRPARAMSKQSRLVRERKLDRESENQPKTVDVPVKSPKKTHEGEAFWMPQASPDGRLFYFSTLTGVSSTELPGQEDETEEGEASEEAKVTVVPSDERLANYVRMKQELEEVFDAQAASGQKPEHKAKEESDTPEKKQQEEQRTGDHGPEEEQEAKSRWRQKLVPLLKSHSAILNQRALQSASTKEELNEVNEDEVWHEIVRLRTNLENILKREIDRETDVEERRRLQKLEARLRRENARIEAAGKRLTKLDQQDQTERKEQLGEMLETQEARLLRVRDLEWGRGSSPSDLLELEQKRIEAEEERTRKQWDLNRERKGRERDERRSAASEERLRKESELKREKENATAKPMRLIGQFEDHERDTRQKSDEERWRRELELRRVHEQRLATQEESRGGIVTPFQIMQRRREREERRQMEEARASVEKVLAEARQKRRGDSHSHGHIDEQRENEHQRWMQNLERRDEVPPEYHLRLESGGRAASASPCSMGLEEVFIGTVPAIVVQDPEGEDEVNELLKEWTTVLG